MSPADRHFRIFAACVVVGLLAVASVNLLQARGAPPAGQTLSYSAFLDAVEAGRIESLTLSGAKIVGRHVDHTVFNSYAADDPELIGRLRKKGVAITVEAPAARRPWATIAATVFGLILLAGIGLPFVRQRVRDGGGAGRGQSKARRLTPAQGRVSFADVAGADEAIESLREIVDFLREPKKFQRLGGRIPRGVLLVGPPGTGKTLLARAVAGEAGVPFFSISGSDFVEMFVGVGAARVRAMFEQARKAAPCIIFMDEIDAVGRRRGVGAAGGGSDEREQTLNQLLVEMDGFETEQGVILIAATNRPDVLDPALLRPGRFDRQIVSDNPDVLGREQILKVHVRKLALAADVDLARIARGTAGFSGAALMNLVNEAALLAARRDLSCVGPREFDDARDTVTMGVERRTHVMSMSEKRLIAYRESGRATVALHLPAADPVHKLTIVTRGRASGMVKQLPVDDSAAITLEQMRARLAILMAGRAAEELIFGPDQLTSGSAGDIAQATQLARRMVTRYGLSAALGPVAYEEAQADEDFLGGPETLHRRLLSEDCARLIAAETRRYIDVGVADARRILSANRAALEALAQTLLQRETLTGDEIRQLLVLRPQPVRSGQSPRISESIPTIPLEAR